MKRDFPSLALNIEICFVLFLRFTVGELLFYKRYFEKVKIFFCLFSAQISLHGQQLHKFAFRVLHGRKYRQESCA